MTQSVTLRRLLYVLACLLPVWAVIAYFSGGVGWMLGPVRISSRQPLRPLLIGLALGGWYFWQYSRADRATDGRWLIGWVAKATPIVLPAAAVLAFVLGVHFGTFAAAGSDSYGYVSQARLWLSGTLRVAQPLVEEFSWKNRDWMFSPLGYRPVSPDGTIVPTYPAGFPIMMALFLGIFGDNGPYYVVPVFGALTLALTYLLGKEATGSRGTAALATLLLMASPVFLAHLLQPMSDIPGAAGWTLVCWLVLKQRSMAAGWAAGLTLLIRPNLFPLAFLPVVAWQKDPETHLLRYAKGIAPSLIAIMALNTYLYDGPLTFGYGTIFESYWVSALPRNLYNYLRWLLETQTPLILLAILPLVVKGVLRERTAGMSPRECLGVLVGLTFLSYLFYAVFDHWFYLRFLLPAYPALFILMAAALIWLSQRLPAEARVTFVALICAVMMGYGVHMGRETGIFNVAQGEQRYVRAAAEVASRTPDNAVVLSVQHSGSVRYYAHRTTLRYDWLPADDLDAAIHDLAAKGHPAFLVVDDWEQKEFQARFSPTNRLGRLDWAPVARVSSLPAVVIFQLQDSVPAAPQ